MVEGGYGQVVVAGDGVLGQVANAQALVKGSHAGHLVVAGGIRIVEPVTQLVGIIALCKAYGIDEQESLLVVHDVATDFLAEGCRIAPHVKHVVPELECQTHVHTGIIEQVGLLFIGIGDEGTGLEGATQQDRRLEADHVDILLDSDVGAVLVVHVPLLALVNLDGGLVEQVHHLPVGSAGYILRGDG